MRKILFISFLLPILSIAQNRQHRPLTDSADIFAKEYNKLFRQHWDTFNRLPRVMELREKQITLATSRNSYVGNTLFLDICHSDYAKFNSSISSLGFSTLNEISTRFGFGVCGKSDNSMFEFDFFVLGFNNKTSKSNETIKASLSNLLQFEIGYDILDNERLSLYPYAGLSLRFSTIKYNKSGQDNTNFTNITNMKTDENNLTLNSTRLGYQYGLGFDYAFAYNKCKTAKTILFTKFGVNLPFKKDTYENSYNPEIKQGDWLISLGFKFVSKR